VIATTGQLDLFESVLRAYGDGKPRSNALLYEQLRDTSGLPAQAWEERQPIGKSGELHSPLRRRLRWFQQSLKAAGVIERLPDLRGVWQATAKGKEALTPAPQGEAVVAFSTELGVALWADCSAFRSLQEPITLILSSPPYALSRPRAYGGPSAESYVDFICEALEPLVRRMTPEGSLTLNVSNDVFIPGSPARSLCRERLAIALHERLGLHAMDTLIWHNSSKPPGPAAWASKRRVQLNVAWEPVLWFAKDPLRVKADNRRVLLPHTERHQRLIARGGEARDAVFGDGAYRIRHGAFGNATEGRIPRNVLAFGHRCKDQDRYRAYARERGLPVHAAAMPLALASFLVRWLTEPGDLVVDPFAGTVTTGRAAEVNGRRWIATEQFLQYLLGAEGRFDGAAESRQS
jgi:hypothetical protein